MTFYGGVIIDALVKSQFWPAFVIPAKAGIQLFKHVMDSRLRGNDRLGDFLRGRHYLWRFFIYKDACPLFSFSSSHTS